MNHEHLDILMNRAVDGKATAPEREELARALLADPTLRSEYDELVGAHISTVALFERLELPEDFTSRVMRRVQPDHVPTDADLTAIIEESDMPEPLPSPALASGKTAHWRRQAKVTTILSTVGALSAAAALLLAIGLLTGIIGSNKSQQQSDAPVSGQPNGPAERRSPAPTPAPMREPGTPGEAIRQPEVPDSPKPEKAPENPQPKDDEEEEDKLPPVEKHPPKDEELELPKEPVTPKEDTAPPSKKVEEPAPKGPSVEKPPTESNPKEVPGPSVEPKKTPEPVEPDSTDPQPKATQPPAAWGRMLSVPSGRVNLPDENGKAIVLDTEIELRVGMKLTTSANCVSVFNWRGGGFFAAGKRTEVTLMLDGFNFEAGEMAVDFEGGKVQPVVVFGAYALNVKSGVVLLVHKTAKKVSISQSSGQSTLKFGEQTLVIEAGAQVDIEFGKMPASPKTKPFVLPEWCGVVRREINLARLEKQLASRKLTRGETTSLQDQIERLGRLPHSSYKLSAFMNRVLELDGFVVKDLINMLGDIEEAFQGNQELTLDDTIALGLMCTCEVKNYGDWSKIFSNKLRELAKRDLVKEAKEKEARKAEEEKRARNNEQGSGTKDVVKDGKKVEDAHDGEKALDKTRNEEPKKEQPKD